MGIILTQSDAFFPNGVGNTSRSMAISDFVKMVKNNENNETASLHSQVVEVRILDAKTRKPEINIFMKAENPWVSAFTAPYLHKYQIRGTIT